MAYNAIVNAAPMTILLGTQDISGRLVPREPEAVPTHCAKFFHFAKKGPVTPQLVVGGSRTALYGTDSFDLRKKWANHSTLFSNGVNQEGNAHVIERVVPTDAGPKANLTLWLEVAESEVDDYERNSDGSIKLAPITNLPVIKTGGPIDGIKLRWVVTQDTTELAAQAFGQRTVAVATLPGHGATPTVTGERIPIMDLKMSYIGEDGNNTGIRLWAPTNKGAGQFDKRIMTREKVYPFRIGVVRKNEKTGTARLQDTLFGEQTVLATFKPDVIASTTDSQISFSDVFLNSYQNLTDVGLPPLFGEFGESFLYDDNIAMVMEMVYTAEKTYIDANAATAVPAIKSDFSSTTGLNLDEMFLANILSAQSSEAYPYHVVQMVNTGPSAVRPSEFTNIFAAGGSDGTMNDTVFAALVSERMAEYADENSDIHNTAINVESIVYDSGFPLDTKYALTDILANRKDTFCALGTHEVGGPILTASQENSLAIALRTRLQLYPESEYFGTHVMRGMVMGRSGKIRSSQFKKNVSPLYEVAVKSARYMGAGNGKWKAGKHFDGAPGSILDLMYDINVPYTSASVRNRDWDAGLNWVQSYDRRSNFIPALKTVYNDDTSVLTSFFTAMIIVEINKVCERAWRYFSGVSNLTDAQLAERVDRFITENTEGRFDSRVVIVPTTSYTDADVARGYSWTTQVKIYANNMKTVMTAYVQSERMSALVPATA